MTAAQSLNKHGRYGHTVKMEGCEGAEATKHLHGFISHVAELQGYMVEPLAPLKCIQKIINLVAIVCDEQARGAPPFHLHPPPPSANPTFPVH